MSSIAPQQPDPHAADEIVAYLDGELPPQECRRVEDRLASDEKYRRQLHELDRAWEALDVLPTPSVGDDFSRTTIELACVAAKEDVNKQASIRRAIKQNRTWRWIAASAAALAFGLLAGFALLPNPNKRLLADLPAIHQVNVLKFVDDIDVLREISKAVPADQMIKDDAALSREVNELKSANDASLDVRRDWLKSLPPDRKADLEDRVRAFSELNLSQEEQQRMRNVVEGIRHAPDAAKLEETLAAYDTWLSRHNAGQQQQLREEIDGKTPAEIAKIVRKRVERESELAMHHLSKEEAETFRTAVFEIIKKKRPELLNRLAQNRNPGRGQISEEQRARQAMSAFASDLLKADHDDRQEIQNELISKLGPEAKAQWAKLLRRPRDFGRGRQLAIWFRDAMNVKVDPEELERFFAEGEKLTAEQRERLLNQSRTRFDNQLEQMYFSSELGIDVPQLGDPGVAQRGAMVPGSPMRRRGAAGMGGPAGQPIGPRRFREQRGKGARPDLPPGEHRPPASQPHGPKPPPKDGKPAPI